MRVAEAVHDYVTLAVRLDALLPGAADVTGTRPVAGPDSAARVVRDAGLLAAALPDVGLEPERERFLLAQLVAVEWTARRLAGQRVSFGMEVGVTYGVRTGLGDEDRYRQAHRELAGVLPGRGALAGRMRAHRDGDRVPPERLELTVLALSTALRDRTRELVPLPDGESVEYRVVAGAPWTALHQYLGGFRSRITVNAGAGLGRAQLVHLVAHEAYPGHHTERCRKEAGLVAARWAEHRVTLACSPQSTIAEAAADLGLDAVAGTGWGRLASAVLPGFDSDFAERVHMAAAALARVRLDAAVLLHDHRAPVADVLAYLRRWALLDDAQAGRVVRFLRHPLWRAYPATYVEGGELLRRWWERDPRPERFVRLLDEPLTPAGVRAELGEPSRSGSPTRMNHSAQSRRTVAADG